MFVEHKEAVEITEQPAKLLEWQTLMLKAAGILEDRGWCQNDYRVGERLCLLGALKVAAGVPPEDGHYHDAVGVACLQLSSSIGHWCVHGWNDELGRTQDEVVAKLRAVALDQPS